MTTELNEGLRTLRRRLLGLHKVLLHALPPEQPPLWPREELQFACYDPGGFYAPHEDASPSASSSPSSRGVERVLTAIYYPNEGGESEWEGKGGTLRLWPREGDYRAETIAPIGDRLVLFISNRTHEVTPVVDAGGGTRRCAFTQWFSAVV